MHNEFYANLEPGKTLFSEFTLERCLSAGDLGGVYLCSLLADPSKVIVLKVLSSICSLAPIYHANFYREHAIANRVQHQNVLHSEKYYRDDTFTAFTMEYVPGGTLADYLETTGPLPIHEVIRLLKRIGCGLQAIHDAGIIHRDLKPENILRDDTGNIKIADFGIAVPLQEIPAMAEKEIVGTLHYLAPEYVSQGALDFRTDIFSLGVIGYELLTGTLPFSNSNLFDALRERVLYDPSPASHVRLDCPTFLSKIIMRAIERNPEKRFKNVQELLHFLDIAADLFEDAVAPIAKAS